ncbi:hypothetical protein LXA43DRAFT_992260 [Ganoderma leucocontextum]|nr:hypothetical protein LXA43DRAFT_992260 [Ganoderma leucocontextum]
MSADSRRPLKRTRLSDREEGSGESPPPQSLSDLKHHDEFWFEDGNLILVARGVGFRIYRGLLASQSSIFADMFASSSANADEVLDGCPVVHMSDSPCDLAHLLRVLLPKSQRTYYFNEAPPVRTFDEVFAVISLAHKYNIQDVEAQALNALRDNGFSSDFALCSNLDRQPRVTAINSIGVVILARLTDASTMLPLALFQCTIPGSVDIVRGWKREDGTVEHLSPEDLARCINGRNALVPHEILLPSRFFKNEPSSDCRTGTQCLEVLRNMLVFVSGDEKLSTRRALDDWTMVLRQFATLGIPTLQGGRYIRVCTYCEAELLARHQRERMRMWELLPEVFGVTVDGWPKTM